MSDPIRFLTALSQALSAMALYAEAHPARQRAMDAAYQELCDLKAAGRDTTFSFLGDEVVYGQQPLRALKSWDWNRRFAQAGIQRLEFGEAVSRDEFELFLDEALARLTLSAIDSSEARQTRRTSIRFGEIGLRGEREKAPETAAQGMHYTLSEEVDTLRWVHEEVATKGVVPLTEADAVVRSLAVAMHDQQKVMLPLLQLKEFDQYTTTHSLNVAVLSMGFAEYLGLAPTEVRLFGVAGLLHDIGKTRIPLEVLIKPGKFTDAERALMNQHPAEGARILLDTEETLEIAAIVAYEHHIMIDGGGYPSLHFRRDCHRASKLVHVCDVFDALRTNRPYRDAWPLPRVLEYFGERAGLEFEHALVTPFVRMMGEWEQQVQVIQDVAAPLR